MIDHQLSDQLQQQIDGSASVFVLQRARAENEDEEMALRIAFVVGGANDVRFIFKHHITGGKDASRAYGRFKSIQAEQALGCALRALSLLHHP